LNTITRTSSTTVEDFWVPVLKHFSETSPEFGVWKNADSALAGQGDVDTSGPARDWPEQDRFFRQWAEEHGLYATTCDHVPGNLFLIAFDRDSETFLEMDINGRKHFRGSIYFRPHELVPLMTMDPRGFRRLRRGAEAFLVLFMNGLKRGGRMDMSQLQKRRVREGLLEDPEGMVQAAELFGIARKAALQAGESVAEGSWNRKAMLAVEGRALSLALTVPQIAVGRFWFRSVVMKRCPIVSSMNFNHRHIPEDFDAWVEKVRAAHVVTGGARVAA
jgi:hypothetical protein